ncbi:MAG: hypothetical protein JWM68_5761 [Verrucomicrobiales bacterium]|nr:hypothetical protein [Verrucomicrobiales bacterium]
MPHGRLQLLFSTHDVTLTCWRRRDFLRLLQDGKTAAIKTDHARYANLRHDLPFVAEIKIAQVKAEQFVFASAHYVFSRLYSPLIQFFDPLL